MSGINYQFDTNALIQFFAGHPNLQKYSSSSVCLSVVSVIEFLSFPNITEADRLLLRDFINEIEVINLSIGDWDLINRIAQLRSSFKIKFPDAVIAATAIYKQAILITNDKDFSKITPLKILSY